MAPLSMLKADIVWLNHINCLLMVFILEILHIVITIQRQEIKNDLKKSCPPFIRPNIYFRLNIIFTFHLSFSLKCTENPNHHGLIITDHIFRSLRD